MGPEAPPQIKECALFVPVVSANTQERREGYFRLEWKLATERTHLMAEGVPFIAPVVIDETKEANALVPAEFMRVQWTRLPGAKVTPEFAEQVKRLLAPGAGGNDGGGTPSSRSTRRGRRAPSSEATGGPCTPRATGLDRWRCNRRDPARCLRLETICRKCRQWVGGGTSGATERTYHP